MHDVLRTNKDGYMYAPTKPGLGVEINWDQMKTRVIHSIYCDKNKEVGLVHV